MPTTPAPKPPADKPTESPVSAPVAPPATEADREDKPEAAGPPPPANTTPEQVVAPADWQATTQPEKPFETAEDREVAERTKPEDLEFTTQGEAPPPEPAETPKK